MSTSRIPLVPVLSAGECAAIDAFCRDRPAGSPTPELAAFLADRFGVSLVLDPSIVEGFVTDSSNLKGSASALCRPASERECAAALRACFAAGIPVTVSAGKSNLTGSATPEGGVVLSTVRMLAPPVAVSAGSLAVRSPVGIIVEELRKAVLEQSGGSLAFPVDPTSRSDATVGGALACNASGFTPGERGSFRPWVEELDFLLPDGRKVSARRGQYVSEGGLFRLVDDGAETALPVPRYRRPSIKNAGGPFSSPEGSLDFVDLAVGSEGIFGVATSCTLRLSRRPAGYLDLFFSLKGEAEALCLRREIGERFRGNLGGFSAFEYFGVNCRRYMSHETRFFRADHQVAVYLQVPLVDRGVDEAAEEWLGILLESGCGVEEEAILLLDNERDRALFLEARHSMPANSLEVVKRHGTFTIMTDTVVPPDRFAEFLDFTHARIRGAGIEYLSFGHLGDCHLHFTLLPTAAQVAEGVAVYDDVVARSADLGGVYSGEHGTGKRKRKDFLRCYGPEAAQEVRRAKAALDPRFLLNRGNVVEYQGGNAV